jgi:hypothetical protein
VSNASEKYLAVSVKPRDGFIRGGVRHPHGKTYYAEGHLEDLQVDAILSDKTGHISAEWVDSVPEGISVIGAEVVPGDPDSPPVFSKDYVPAEGAIDVIETLGTEEEVYAFVEGDGRKGIADAVSKRLDALKAED